MLGQQQYRFSDDGEAAFCEYLVRRMRQPRFANARSVRNALDRARLRQANRLFESPGQLTKRDLVALTAADIRASRVFSEEPGEKSVTLSSPRKRGPSGFR
jgi:hypothetical protein